MTNCSTRSCTRPAARPACLLGLCWTAMQAAAGAAPCKAPACCWGLQSMRPDAMQPVLRCGTSALELHWAKLCHDSGRSSWARMGLAYQAVHSINAKRIVTHVQEDELGRRATAQGLYQHLPTTAADSALTISCMQGEDRPRGWAHSDPLPAPLKTGGDCWTGPAR